MSPSLCRMTSCDTLYDGTWAASERGKRARGRADTLPPRVPETNSSNKSQIPDSIKRGATAHRTKSNATHSNAWLCLRSQFANGLITRKLRRWGSTGSWVCCIGHTYLYFSNFIIKI